MFPRASRDTINLNANSEPPGSKPQPTVRNGSLAKKKGKAGNAGRHGVSITSYRVRLLDPDNLTPKYFIDSLRYANLIPGDRPEDIIYSIRQKKVAKKNQEKTLIEITWPS